MLRYSAYDQESDPHRITRVEAKALVDKFFRWARKNYDRREQLDILINSGISPNAQSAVEDFVAHLFKIEDDYDMPDYSYLLRLVEKRLDVAIQGTVLKLFS